MYAGEHCTGAPVPDGKRPLRSMGEDGRGWMVARGAGGEGTDGAWWGAQVQRVGTDKDGHVDHTL